MRRKAIAALIIFLSIVLLPASARPRFALVLSGGGAKGIAHIPILMELDRRGIVPDLVVGTSMGAVIGSFYSAGYSGEELERLVESTDLMSYFLHLYAVRGSETLPSPFTDYDTNLLTVEFGSSGFGASNGLVDDQYINGFLRRHLSKVLDVRDFDDLSIPYRAIGTDITNKRKVVFSTGSLFDAVRASMAIPVVFSPVRLDDGSYIMDGGLEDNLPTDIARDLGADIVLAVDVNDARHIHGEHRNDMSTLSGSFTQFSDYLTEPNSVENYDEADWVIVPDTAGFSSLGFGSTEAILDAGRRAVEENMGVFDALEDELAEWIPDMERVGYGSIDAPEIVRVTIGEEIPVAALPELEEFVGRSMDYYTMTEFESLLDDIRRHEGLKAVTYDIQNGVIEVEGERYPSLSGSLYLGLTGGIGVRYDGSDGREPFFAYTPYFTISGTTALLPRLMLDYGVIVNEGITVEGGVSYPFMSSAFLYGNLGLRYGQQAYSSIPGTIDYTFSDDVGLFLRAGIGYLPMRELRMDAIIGFEYTYLGGDGFGRRHFAHPYIGLGIVFDAYDGASAADNGFEASATLEFGGDFPSPMLSYAFSADIFGCIGPTDIFKFIFDFETETIRRPIDLADAYASTKMGLAVSDRVYAMGGIRLPLPLSFFVDAGIFIEAFGGRHDDLEHQVSRSLVPYSELSMDTSMMDIGGYLGAGIATSFGQITAGLYISATPRVSFMVGIE